MRESCLLAFPSDSWTLRDLLPWLGTAAAVGYAVYVTRKLNRINEDNERRAKGQFNTLIRRGEDKVVDTVYVDELGLRRSLCRCWASKKWPYCDGAHKKLNKEYNQNVGQLVLKSKDWVPKDKKKEKKDKKKSKEAQPATEV